MVKAYIASILLKKIKGIKNTEYKWFLVELNRN